MLKRTGLTIVLIAAVFICGCSSVGVQALTGLGKIMQGLGPTGTQVAGDIIRGAETGNIAPSYQLGSSSLVGSNLSIGQKTNAEWQAQKSLLSPGVIGVGMVSGLVGEIGREKREQDNAKVLQRVKDVFSQAKENAKAQADTPIDLGNGVILKPETSSGVGNIVDSIDPEIAIKPARIVEVNKP